MRLTGNEQQPQLQQQQYSQTSKLDTSASSTNNHSRRSESASTTTTTSNDEEDVGEWEHVAASTTEQHRTRVGNGDTAADTTNSNKSSEDNSNNNEDYTKSPEVATTSSKPNGASDDLNEKTHTTTTSKCTSNPWQKIKSVKPMSLLKSTDEAIDNLASTMSYSRTLSYQNIDLVTPTTMKTSQSVVCGLDSGGETNKTSSLTLDTSDWPSLNAGVLNMSLVDNSNETTKSVETAMSTSKSCSNFNDNDTSSNGCKKQTNGKKQPTKWKPLILETPSKRERERRAHQQQQQQQRSRYHYPSNAKNNVNAGGGDTASGRSRSLERAAANGIAEAHVSNRDSNKMVKSKSTTHRGFAESKSKFTYAHRNVTSLYHNTLYHQTSNHAVVNNTYKDYLYGLDDAIIMEEVPLIVSVDPNNLGVYCTTTVQTHEQTFSAPNAAADTSSSSSTSSSSASSSSSSAIYQPQLPYNNHISPPISLVNQSVPLLPVFAVEQMIELIRGQIDYYFSAYNLNSDMYMRGLMDAYGYIPLSCIAEFNRIRMLSGGDSHVVIAAARRSTMVECVGINDVAVGGVDDIGSILVRARYDPMHWTLKQPTTEATQAKTTTSQLNPDVPEFKPKAQPKPQTSYSSNELIMMTHHAPIQMPPQHYYYAQPFYMPVPSMSMTNTCMKTNDLNNNHDGLTTNTNSTNIPIQEETASTSQL